MPRPFLNPTKNSIFLLFCWILLSNALSWKPENPIKPHVLNLNEAVQFSNYLREKQHPSRYRSYLQVLKTQICSAIALLFLLVELSLDLSFIYGVLGRCEDQPSLKIASIWITCTGRPRDKLMKNDICRISLEIKCDLILQKQNDEY